MLQVERKQIYKIIEIITCYALSNSLMTVINKIKVVYNTDIQYFGCEISYRNTSISLNPVLQVLHPGYYTYR